MAAPTPSAPQVVSVTATVPLTGNAALCLGFYELQAGEVNGRPVWRHASGRDRFLAFGSAGGLSLTGGWRVQQASELGSTTGLLFLVTDRAVLYPSDPIGPGRWRRWDGTTWQMESSLACIEATLPPVPMVVELTCDDGAAAGRLARAAAIGFYLLDAGREVNGRPVWRHAAGRDKWLAFDSKVLLWKVQSEAALGSDKTFMHQSVAAMLYPSDAGSGSWSWYDGNAWKAEPSLTCVEATLPPVPRVVELTGNDDALASRAECLGFYQLEARRVANGRPVWRHAAGRDRWLAFDSKERLWKVQHEAMLGSNKSFMHQAESTLYPSDPTRGGWYMRIGNLREAEPSLTCVEATLPPVPRVLSLTGDGLTGLPAQSTGLYQLEAGREFNGRPVWRHAAGLPRVIAFDPKERKWKVQSEATLGSDTCLMKQSVATLYPSVTAQGIPPAFSSWKWREGNSLDAWKAEPSIACVELQTVDAPEHRPQPPLPTELTGLLSSVRLVRARRWAEAKTLLSDFQPLVDAAAAVSDGVGTSGVGVWCGTGQSSLSALKQVLRSCCEEVAEKAKVLREKQQLVSVAASPVMTSVDSRGDDSAARLQNVVSDRDAARRAYADAISSHLPKVTSARTLSELRDCAAKATAGLHPSCRS